MRIERVADVCSFVDDLDGAAAGELIVTNEETAGAVFVEHARICWAAATGLARRLTELLMLHADVDHKTMESLYRTCKTERTPLGEYLVQRGIVRAEALRAALAQHTVESLVRLTGPGRRAAWHPRPHGGYSPRFTFGTSEVLARAHATAEGGAAERAMQEMAVCFSDDEWAAAFVRGEARAAPEPVALHGPAPASATVLGRSAKWAASSLDVVTACSGGSQMVAVTLPHNGGVLVAFRHDDLVIAGEARAQGAARILNRHARRKHEGG